MLLAICIVVFVLKSNVPPWPLLRNDVAKRVEMLEYPTFRSKDYVIGSGPTEAYCKTLTSRLRGPAFVGIVLMQKALWLGCFPFKWIMATVLA